MPNASIRVVDVYPYRLHPDVPAGVELLLLRRAKGTSYEGFWRMVGGGIDAGEAAWETAQRELREETGCTPDRFWALPSVNTFYEWKSDRISLTPAFAAEISEPITLNVEHDTYAWVSPSEACERLHWPEQQRLAVLTAQMAPREVPPSLIIET